MTQYLGNNPFFKVVGNKFDKRAKNTAGISSCYSKSCQLKDGSGTVSGTVCPNQNGMYVITITKTDQEGNSNTQSATFNPEYFHGTNNPYFSPEETLN